MTAYRLHCFAQSGNSHKAAWMPEITVAELTVADLSCAGYMFYDDEFPTDWSADYPNLTAWKDRIRAQPGWKHPYDLMPGKDGDRA